MCLTGEKKTDFEQIHCISRIFMRVNFIIDWSNIDKFREIIIISSKI